MEFEGKLVTLTWLSVWQTDEGTAFGLRGINTTDELVDSLALNYVALSRNSTANLVSLYSDDPADGCPYNTDGVLPTGHQDKVRNPFLETFRSVLTNESLDQQRSLSINGDIQMTAPRRNLAQAASRYSPVYSYRFDTVAENATVLTGVSLPLRLDLLASSTLTPTHCLSR